MQNDTEHELLIRTNIATCFFGGLMCDDTAALDARISLLLSNAKVDLLDGHATVWIPLLDEGRPRCGSLQFKIEDDVATLSHVLLKPCLVFVHYGVRVSLMSCSVPTHVAKFSVATSDLPASAVVTRIRAMSERDVEFQFVPGAPREPCRRYLPNELQTMLSEHLLDASIKATPPIAIIVSGLPGSGKTSRGHAFVKRFCQAFSVSEAELVTIDCDQLRSYHGQFREYARSKTRIVHQDLLPWFMDGTNFEKVIFQDEDALVPRVLQQKLSFCLHAVCASESNVVFVRHLIREGYRIGFVHFDVSVNTAITRAELRAFKSGRWTSPDFIRARHCGIGRTFAELAHIVLQSGGFVAKVDNERENENAELCWCAPKLETYDELPEMFWEVPLEDRVAHLATMLLKPIFALLGESTRTIDFALAGGCFKSLLRVGHPNDLDLWPLSADSKSELLRLLTDLGSRGKIEPLEGPFNTQFSVHEVAVEVVKRVHQDLAAVLSGFDLVVSSVGCHITASYDAVRSMWMLYPTQVIVHPLFQQSLQEKKSVILVQPFPNVPFLLATGERVLRHARDLGLCSKEAMSLIMTEWMSSSSQKREELISNYKMVTKDYDARKEIEELFCFGESSNLN